MSQQKVIILQLDPELTCLRALNLDKQQFEMEYSLGRGSSTNSFLFPGSCSGNAVLLYPPGQEYTNVFLGALEHALPSTTRQLQVVVGHINPSCVSLLRRLSGSFTNLEVISSRAGAVLLENLWNQHPPVSIRQKHKLSPALLKCPQIHVIRNTELLNLGAAGCIQLLPAPTPRWPGGLLAFEEQRGLLMSGKLFAAHLHSEKWAEVSRSSTEEDRQHFYDCLIAPMAGQVDALIERFERLDIRTIAPEHGPAIESSWRSLMADYRRWGEAYQKGNIKILLLYASAYGSTASIADALARGINRTGVRILSINCEFASTAELLDAIRQASAVLIGSPTIGGHAPTPIVSALGTLLAQGDRSCPIGVFGSYGWSGEALDLLETKLRDGGFHFGFEPIRIRFSPDSSMVRTLEETGARFAQQLLQQEQRRQQQQRGGGLNESSADSATLALGRIVGSLCILTIASKNEQGATTQQSEAMVASWVSQASFLPPGITVAVAKNQSVEKLLQIDDCFALNILADGRSTNLLKQFLQSSPPDADCFADLKIEYSPNGQPLLPGALAWLEAKVEERMECGDHWLIYAEIHHGGLFDAIGATAVHRRRSGASY
ncbi:flavin oxidoreductase [cyanobiont of Ornithocercus magnificus]|nr:flavin oxidoreductase [cyanobiont of Ornithocercus magnificus]